jgi:hypothetical protein
MRANDRTKVNVNTLESKGSTARLHWDKDTTQHYLHAEQKKQKQKV